MTMERAGPTLVDCGVQSRGAKQHGPAPEKLVNVMAEVEIIRSEIEGPELVPQRVDAECQCSALPRDALEDRLRAIESELVANRQVMQTLTTLVQALHPPLSGPSMTLVKPSAVSFAAAPTIVAAPPGSSPGGADDGDKEERSATQKPPIKQRRHSNEAFISMTRTISVKDIPAIHGDSRTASSPLLESVAKVLQQIARLSSRYKRRVLDSPVPMMARQPTAKALGSGTDEKSFSRRLTLCSQAVLAKTARVMPSAAMAEARAGWLEDCPPHPFTIRCDSSVRIAWDVFVMFLILIDVVLTPLSLSFGCLSRLLTVFNATETVAFTIDFVVQALSSYTTKRGIMVTGPANTIPNYLSTVWAVADLLAWFPFEYIIPEGQFLGIAKVVRLAKFSELMRRLHSTRKAGMLRLIRLISIVLLVSHCLACYWNWVAKVWRQTEDGYLEKSTVDQYIHSWAIIIGSLNASPPIMHTPIEEISVALFMLIGNVIQASVFGSVAVLIQSFDEDEVAYNKKLTTTYERCKLLDIPDPLVDRITRYYEHLYRETHSVDPDADAFINELSPALICEVKFQLYRDMVRQIPFFSSSNINPVLIETLILKLRTVIYMQDDMLIRKGEFGDWMGFIGSKGSVGVLDPNSKAHKILRVLRRGEYFGEMGLLHRTKRTTTAVALSWVQIHVLTRGDLDDLKEQYVEDAESLEDEIRKYMKSRVFSIREGQK